MRSACAAFGFAMAAFVVFPAAEAAAVVADLVTFTPVSLQPETDAAIYSYAALVYLPVWTLLVCAGIGVRRLEGRWFNRAR